MPRRAKPHWSEVRKRWYANIGEKDANGRAQEVYAPQTIRKRDEGAAWKWFEAQQSADAPLQGGRYTIQLLCEDYQAWCEQRRDAGRLAAAHVQIKKSHLGHFLVFGPRLASTLTAHDLTEFLSGLLSRGYSRHYVRGVARTVNAALHWAASPRAKILATHPAKGFELPTLPRSPVRFAEKTEAAAFLRFWRSQATRGTVQGRYERLTILLERCLIRTGARPMELCGLRWQDLTWQGWTTSTGQVCAKAVIPWERWKAGDVTGKPRTIYFPPLLTRALRREHRRPDRHPEAVFTHGPGRGGRGAGEPWSGGSRLSKTILRVRRDLIAYQEQLRQRVEGGEILPPWEARLLAVEIQDTGAQRLTNYRWRHTAISSLLMLGVDVPTVAELTGTSPDMIHKHYGHLLDRHLAAAAEKLGHRT